MDWFKKHVDTVIVLGAIFGSFLWVNNKFSEMNKRFSKIEQDLAIIKTILIMKGIMPEQIISKNKEVEKSKM